MESHKTGFVLHLAYQKALYLVQCYFFVFISDLSMDVENLTLVLKFTDSTKVKGICDS